MKLFNLFKNKTVLLYASCLICLISALVGVVFDQYYFFILPFVVIFLYLFLVYTESILLLTIFSVPLSIPINNIGGGLGLSLPTEPLIILFFLGFIVKLLTGFQIASLSDKRLLNIIVLSLISWLLICTIFSSMPLVSLKYCLAQIWFIFIFYYLSQSLFQNTKYIHWVFWLLSISTFILVIYTLYNHSAGGFTRTYAYTAMRPFLPDHGIYGALISFFVPFLFIAFIHGFELKYNFFTIMIAFVLFIVITIGVILSFTRASWLSLIVSLLLYFGIIIRIKFSHIIFFIVIGVCFVSYKQLELSNQLSRNKQGSADDIEQHVASISNVSTDPSNLERLNRWRCAFRMFSEKPIIGWGPGTYTFQYGAFQVPSEMTIISTNAGDMGNVHSEYFRPLAEQGIIGFLIFVSLVLASLYYGLQTVYQAINKEIKYLAMALLMGLVTYWVHGLLNNYSDYDKIAVPVWLFLAGIMALNKKNKSLAYE